MPNINLSTENVSKARVNPFGKSLTFSIIILVFLLIVYGILLVVNQGLISKIKVVQGEYNVEYENFLAGKSGEILDFKNRSDLAEKFITENESMPGALAQIEKSILPSVYLNSFSYDKSKNLASISCVGDSFQTIAKQVLSLKQNEYFSNVMLGRSSMDQENPNKFNFNIDLIIK